MKFIFELPTNGAPSVRSLRSSGFKVRITHMRRVKTGFAWLIKGQPELLSLFEIKTRHLQHCIIPNGGKVLVNISIPGWDGNGEAVCSDKDPYVKRAGLSLALSRALLSCPTHPIGATSYAEREFFVLKSLLKKLD